VRGARTVEPMRTHPIVQRPLVALAASVALLGLAAGCASSSDGATTTTTSSAEPTTTAAPATGVPVGDPEDVTTGLDAPWSMTFVGQTTLISERDSGKVLELLGDGTTRTVGTVPGVVHRAEDGLLGLAVSDQQDLYAYSTGTDGNRVQRFELTGRPGSYGLGAAQTILDDIPANSTHNGGRLAFGPDGMLYVTVGDAQDRPAAQDTGSLSGKILRMTTRGEVPADNPIPGSLVYSYGHRNVQGIGWADDGTMFASEFGQDTWDELNIIEPGGNYGWPDAEGQAGDARFIDPVQQWPTKEASPSGIVVAGDTVFVANLRGEVLRAIPVGDPSTATDHYQGTYGRLRAVAVGPDGFLWLLTNNTDGRGDPARGDDRILRVRLS